MDTKTFVKRRGIALAVLLAVGVDVHEATAAQLGRGSGGLIGTWFVEVTLRDCTTDAPLGPPFRSLGTYNEGGTLVDTTAALGFAIGQRSVGLGNWTHDGAHQYSQVIAALLLFDTPANLPGTPGFDPAKPVTPGFLAGWQIVRHAIELVDRDHWTSKGTNAFYNTAGALYRTGCSSAVATRVE
jgi:hypothetical protein